MSETKRDVLTKLGDESVSKQDPSSRQNQRHCVVDKHVSRQVTDVESDGVGQHYAADPVGHEDQGPGLQASPKHVVPVELFAVGLGRLQRAAFQYRGDFRLLALCEGPAVCLCNALQKRDVL